MQKTFCDICGEQLKVTYFIEFTEPDADGHGGMDTFSYDTCEKCYRKIKYNFKDDDDG